MNPVLVLTRNNLELTKQCVESVRTQDIPAEIFVFDNDSTDGTSEWIEKEFPLGHRVRFSWNRGVSYGWNFFLRNLFDNDEHTHALILNNDAIIPPWYYRRLLAKNELFITGIAVDQMPTEEPEDEPFVPHPDFSAFLIRRECWEQVGKFDESMKLYAQDCDYHIRAHRLGIEFWKTNLPYFHINSQTLKRADPTERAEIQAQADRDREVFRAKYGCLPGTKEYAQLFEK